MFSAYCDFCTLMHESVNTFVGHMCPTRAGNMCPTYCKSNAKLSISDAYTAHLTTSLLFSCLISFGRCFDHGDGISRHPVVWPAKVVEQRYFLNWSIWFVHLIQTHAHEHTKHTNKNFVIHPWSMYKAELQFYIGLVHLQHFFSFILSS